MLWRKMKVGARKVVTAELLLHLPHLHSPKERRVPISNHEVNIPRVPGDRKNIEGRSVDNDNCGKIPIKPEALRDPPFQEKLLLSQAALCPWRTT